MSTTSSTTEKLEPGSQLSNAPSEVLDTFNRAVSPAIGQRRPGGQTLTTALLKQEHQAKREKWTMAVDDLLGTWRLCFTAPNKPTYKAGQPTGKGFYVPSLIRATLAFSKNSESSTELAIQNQLQLAAVKLRFTGPAKLLPQKNLVAFDFDRLQLLLGQWSLFSIPVRAGRSQTASFKETPVGKLPFFSFFAATESYLAARGRGGGLALWQKQA
jgi:hypothetical protein